MSRRLSAVFFLMLSLTVSSCTADDGPWWEEEASGAVSQSSFVDTYHSPLKQGPYAVGSKSLFIVDSNRRFDPWGEVFGTPPYRALLADLEAAGEPRSLVAEIWYPVIPGHTHGHARATYLDYYFGDRSIFERRGVTPTLLTASGETVDELSQNDPQAFVQLADEVFDELARRQRNSFVDAPIANGDFPLIVLSHGGFIGEFSNSSHREVWTTEAENLASHGYVVIAMNHTGDSRHAQVFHNPASPFAQQSDQQTIDAAYETMFTEPGVPDKLFGLLFNPTAGMAVVHQMFQQLFQQRVDDVVAVIEHAKQLNNHSNGFFYGHIDVQHIGVAGFSLGSMTTQAALSSVADIDTGIAWNNGMPKAWEPASFQGIDKPILFSLGTEDELTRTIFTNLPYFIYPSIVPSGKPSDFLLLPAEQAFPLTPTNPEPIVQSTFDRAQGPKMLVKFIDMRHWDVVDSEDYLFPLHELQSDNLAVGFNPVLRRLPIGAEVLDPDFVGAEFSILGWEQLGNSPHHTYQPHKIRSYYSVAWFGLHLKGIERYRKDLLDDPFSQDTVVVAQGID